MNQEGGQEVNHSLPRLISYQELLIIITENIARTHDRKWAETQSRREICLHACLSQAHAQLQSQWTWAVCLGSVPKFTDDFEVLLCIPGARVTRSLAYGFTRPHCVVWLLACYTMFGKMPTTGPWYDFFFREWKEGNQLAGWMVTVAESGHDKINK